MHGESRFVNLLAVDIVHPSCFLHSFTPILLLPRTARYLTIEPSRNVGQPEKSVINRRRGRTSFLGRKSLSTTNSVLSRVTLNYANSQSGKYNRSPDDELLRAVCCRPRTILPISSHSISFTLVGTHVGPIRRYSQ